MANVERIESWLGRIEAGQAELEAQIRNLVTERNALRAALIDLEFIFEGQEDIKDGPEGQQLPNDAMSALTVIRRALYGE